MPWPLAPSQPVANATSKWARAISITGYGNSSASAFSDPPLTTIDHAVFDNGRHIGQSLLRLIRGEAKPADIHYLEPVVLVTPKVGWPAR